MIKTYTFWFYGSCKTFDAETTVDAMAQANDHFEPLACDPDGYGAWNFQRGCYSSDAREFIWY